MNRRIWECLSFDGTGYCRRREQTRTRYVILNCNEHRLSRACKPIQTDTHSTADKHFAQSSRQLIHRVTWSYSWCKPYLWCNNRRLAWELTGSLQTVTPCATNVVSSNEPPTINLFWIKIGMESRLRASSCHVMSLRQSNSELVEPHRSQVWGSTLLAEQPCYYLLLRQRKSQIGRPPSRGSILVSIQDRRKISWNIVHFYDKQCMPLCDMSSRLTLTPFGRLGLSAHVFKQIIGC